MPGNKNSPNISFLSRHVPGLPRAALAAFAASALAASVVLAAPGCGNGEPAPTTTVIKTVTGETGTGTSMRDRTSAQDRTGSRTSAGTDDIRAVDWRAQIGTQPLLRDVENVIYADLTGDGREDALVLVRLEGSGAYLDYYVFTLEGGEVVMLFEKLQVSHGQVELGPQPQNFVETTAVYGPDDPNCCPSNLMRTTYAWSASARVFTQVTVELTPNPQAQQHFGSRV